MSRRYIRDLVTQYGAAAGVAELSSEDLRKAWHPDEPGWLTIALDPEPDALLGDHRPQLYPFKPEAVGAYLALIKNSVQRRERRHAELVNDFMGWLSKRNVILLKARGLDMVGVADPPVIIEAEVIRHGDWARSIREAVGQLLEYRHFELADPTDALMFLASEPVDPKWVRYLLEGTRGIVSGWQLAQNEFELTPEAFSALGLLSGHASPRADQLETH